MKIMIHSNGPMVPSGYGRQTALAVRVLQKLGHDVAVSAFHGVSGAITEWKRVPVYPAGLQPYGVDVILPHANHFGAELLLTLMDTWTLAPILEHLAGSLALEGAPRMACWTPIDCDPISQGDRMVLGRTGAIPIGMSNYGVNAMLSAGLENVWYIPHAIDTDVYRYMPDQRLNVRNETGTGPDTFVIGIVAANKDLTRKAWAEQLQAFALHLYRHPDSELWVHTIANGLHRTGGFNLREMAQSMGIGHAVRWSDEYAQIAGLIDDEDMALWYNAIDLLSNCSYGEGFGLPIVEAQACGRPALATKASSMPELATETVTGVRWWNSVHGSWWVRPTPQFIAEAYNRFRAHWESNTAEAPQRHVDRVAQFDVNYVTTRWWEPFLAAVEADRRPSSQSAESPTPFERESVAEDDARREAESS